MRFRHTLNGIGRGGDGVDEPLTAAAAAAVATVRARWSLRDLWEGIPSLDLGIALKVTLVRRPPGVLLRCCDVCILGTRHKQ